LSTGKMSDFLNRSLEWYPSLEIVRIIHRKKVCGELYEQFSSEILSVYQDGPGMHSPMIL